ncbi:zonular occludens toxin domain-containing protein [Brevibacillus brevis]|uniref:Zonular occludens toxin domain-containing protein n=1 Tax=Brevibacillus brevis TaxID=1393 RepID=A0ABY9TCQ5_BREBE|nr:zonular occludens toxin domain-containing protein [Brevibacillus brevis]WNC17866.1 zonular occludens toxin domain-containing protein [Brevibacillus brevis]
MIWQYTGTIGSGKSYHALEQIINTLKQGKHVIANFPLNFPAYMVRKGFADRFLYIPDKLLEDERGIAFLLKMSKDMQFNKGEGNCLVVIDEAGNYFPPDQSTSPLQKYWNKFFTQSRKLGYDFILVMQDDKQINRTIRACCEYEIKHRKANNIFPFSLLPFTIFMYVTYWKQTRERLASESSIFVKRFSDLYNTHMLFGRLDEQVSFDLADYAFDLRFGNCLPVKEETA